MEKKLVLPAAPPPPHVPATIPFAEAWSSVRKRLGHSVQRLAELKAVFIQRFNKDGIDAITWKCEEILKAEHDARLAENLFHGLHYKAMATGTGVVLPGLTDEMAERILTQSKIARPATELSGADEYFLKNLARELHAMCQQYLETLERRLKEKARYPARSTSIPSNLSEQQELAALADAVDTFNTTKEVMEWLKWVYEPR